MDFGFPKELEKRLKIDNQRVQSRRNDHPLIHLISLTSEHPGFARLLVGVYDGSKKQSENPGARVSCLAVLPSGTNTGGGYRFVCISL